MIVGIVPSEMVVCMKCGHRRKYTCEREHR